MNEENKLVNGSFARFHYFLTKKNYEVKKQYFCIIQEFRVEKEDMIHLTVEMRQSPSSIFPSEVNNNMIFI